MRRAEILQGGRHKARREYERRKAELARNCCESYARALGALVEHELSVRRLKDHVHKHEGTAP
ncbi:MAG: hypothetical protein FGM15_06650 [Chthoniobacterales bacterium]|nr:hypothetical protein [Chthoniobacterales bacterium]